MASQCKRQQCTIDRRGFRQELDSWRHKLIHCVGFESILEGLFGRELVEDLKLFKDLEPTAVSDWSFDENCLFCCLRRNKVKEHLISLSEEGLEDTPLDKDQARISRLERQAEEFLNAVLCRKDVPNFSDPHIPVVAREILQRMIRQFAAEYTSKTSPSQDSCSDSQPHSDQSLLTPPLPSGAPPSTSPATTVAAPAHNQNPVLSKLLMADQDAPLDLTIKKPLAVPCVQDGVLDLSIKKNRCSSGSSSQPVRSPYLCPAPSSLKGESPYFDVAKAKELQSTSTLEQFMAKLCPHHQRQIVDAIGFLQTEVKAFTASSALQDSKSTSGIQENACSAAKSSAVTPEKVDLKFPSKSKTVSEAKDVSHSIPSSCTMKKVPENAVSLKTSVTADPALDLRSLGSESSQALVNPTANPADTDNSRHGDHAPLKMKIMTSNIADRKKLSCVLNATFSSHSDLSEDRDGNSNSSIRTETHSARLNSPVKRPGPAGHAQQARQRDTLAHTKDAPAKLFSVRMTIPPRTARKTLRVSSDHRIRDSAVRGMVDPDLGHCDIVFIDKPITECFKPPQRGMLPRRNARKSTRGHMYSDEIWELKTVRTLAGRGNCPNPMPELITSVTPKQMLSKPEGLPPVDMPFAGTHRELISQQMSTEESDESVIPGTGDAVEVAASEGEVIVETSQTDQSQSKSQSVPPSPTRYPAENGETRVNTEVEEETAADSGTKTEIEENVPEAPIEAEKEIESEPQMTTCESTEQVVAKTVEPSKTVATEVAEATQPSSDAQLNSDAVLQGNGAPSPVNQVEEETEDNTREEIQEEQPQEVQSEIQTQSDNTEVTEESNTTASAEVVEVAAKEPEINTTETAESAVSQEPEDDEDYDVSSKTMDALLKELPPWRRKRGTEISLPKRLRQKETIIVGYFNGRPISASDRSLRRRSSNSNTSLSKSPVRSNQNIADKTSLDSAVSPNVDNRNQDKSTPGTHVHAGSVDRAPAVQQVEEPLAASRPSKIPARTKRLQKRKTFQRDQDDLPGISDQPGDHPQSTEPKRQLRSAGQTPATTPASPPTSPAVTSSASPKPTATPVLQSPSPAITSSASPKSTATPVLQSPSPAITSSASPKATATPVLQSPSPAITSSASPKPTSAPVLQSPEHLTPSVLPSTSPPITPSRPSSSEQLQQSTVPDNTLELNGNESQPEEINSQEIQKDEGASPATQKLRSAKTVVDEKMQASSDSSGPFEEKSPVKTEAQAQIMPLRNKRNLRKDTEVGDAPHQKPNVASSGDSPTSGDDCSSLVSDKPTRMPLRRESSRPETSHQSVTQSPSSDQKRLSLRSQKFLVPSTSAPAVAGRQSDMASPTRVRPERVTKAQVKPPPASAASVLPCSSATSIFTPSPEPPKQTNKFLETLTGEENQHLISNLNIKFDKMQKGWVQMDKEGQPTTRYKNRADRQAAIWKSRRRARKAKALEHQKYSPVQMLFMKGFSLSSICRWFLESTETKSLVIVKKVNTRLPSETQLCFHSSSSSGTSQGVFPSLQAERLKKHLKKFAIASPVKSNPKSQKMIAKALEQEANAVKGKEKRELPGSAQSHSSQAPVQIPDTQKSSAKSRNPASARILRKYSNIRGKMQVQQTNVRLKEASKTLRTKCLKRLTTSKSTTKSNLKPSLKAQKSALPARKQMKESAAKMGRRKTMAGKKPTKHRVQVRAVKAQSSSRASRDTNKKELPKRYSQRLGTPKITEHKPVDTSKSKVENKKQLEAEKVEVEKPTVGKMNAAKIQAKELLQSTVAEVKGMNNAGVTPLQTVDAPASPDQVLTRSQRKMEAASPGSASPSLASKRLTKSIKTQNASPKPGRKAEEPKAELTRRGALKSPAKRSLAASSPRGATKSAVKRAQELLETPAKRTRTSLSK